jgi:hypothetical protein
VDENNVFVLGSDRNLWLETAPFGFQIPLPPNQRPQVDGKVLEFTVNSINSLYVLGTDRNLWLEFGPFVPNGKVPPLRTYIDGNVGAWQPTSGSDVFVLGTDHKLWREWSPYGQANRAQIDANAESIQSLDSTGNILVLGTDRNLWYEQGPFVVNGPVPPPRIQIDGNVLDYADTNINRG